MIPRNKIESIIARHNDLEKELSSGNINSKTFPQKSKEYSDLSDIVKFADKYLKFENDKVDLENILKDKNSDKEMMNLAEKELESLKENKKECENKLKLFLLPKDKDDKKNVIVEIRAGTGGLEATLFC